MAELPETGGAPWPRRVTTQIGKRLKQGRDELGVSARELSDRTDEHGYRVEYQVIANMETGRRTNISVAELLVLANALKMPPALLVAPVGSEDDVELLPDAPTDPWEAYTWFVGSGRGSTSYETRLRITQYGRHDAAVRLLLRRMEENEHVNSALDAVIAMRDGFRGMGWRLPRLPESGVATTAEADALRKLVEAAELDREIES